MPWLDFVTTQFDLVNRFTSDEGEYYGRFNTLLHTNFSLHDDGYLHHHEVNLKSSCVLPRGQTPSGI
jgi:hypothetical protein